MCIDAAYGLHAHIGAAHGLPAMFACLPNSKPAKPTAGQSEATLASQTQAPEPVLWGLGTCWVIFGAASGMPLDADGKAAQIFLVVR